MLILARSVFRVIEFMQGNDGFIMSHEYMLYIFDGGYSGYCFLGLFCWGGEGISGSELCLSLLRRIHCLWRVGMGGSSLLFLVLLRCVFAEPSSFLRLF